MQNAIADDEKERIRNFRLEDRENDHDAREDMKQSVAAEDSSEEGKDEEDSDANSTYFERREKTLERTLQLRNQQP